MPDMGAGTLLYKQATGVATLSLSPLVPNAAVVRHIAITAQSANDTWVIRTNGQEVGRFYIPTSGSQLLFFNGTSDRGAYSDIFAYCKNVLGRELIYPIPEGKTLVLSSEGGATADIAFAYEEFAPSALNPSMMNYPGGGYYLSTRFFYVNTHPTTIGEAPIDTEIGLSFAPNLFAKGSFPVGWQATVLDVFAQGAGVNAYASTTNHQSTTSYLAAIKNGQRLFTREALGGIPLIGAASAAGSANVVTGYVLNALDVFVDAGNAGIPSFPDPIRYRPGDTFDWRLDIIGDVGAGADYSSARQVAIVEYRSV